MEIIIYSKPNCGACDLTKQTLAAHGVPYVSYDATKDPDMMEGIQSRGFMGFPVVSVNNWERSWSGYNHQELERIIQEAGA